MTRYDEDHSDPSQYCRHGTFIGSWWGPDYLCGFCEDGMTEAEYYEWCYRQRTARVREAHKMHTNLVLYLEGSPDKAHRWPGRFTFLVTYLDVMLEYVPQKTIDEYMEEIK